MENENRKEAVADRRDFLKRSAVSVAAAGVVDAGFPCDGAGPGDVAGLLPVAPLEVSIDKVRQKETEKKTEGNNKDEEEVKETVLRGCIDTR